MTPNVEIEFMNKNRKVHVNFPKELPSCLTFPEFNALWVFSVSFPPAEYFPSPPGGAVAATTSVQ